MAEGLVKWFDPVKGYGYITVLAYASGDITVGKQDVWVHYSDIQSMSYRTLDGGEYVSFAIEPSEKGPIARKVSPLGGPPPSHLTWSPRTMLVVFVFVFVVLVILIVVTGLL